MWNYLLPDVFILNVPLFNKQRINFMKNHKRFTFGEICIRPGNFKNLFLVRKKFKFGAFTRVIFFFYSLDLIIFIEICYNINQIWITLLVLCGIFELGFTFLVITSLLLVRFTSNNLENDLNNKPCLRGPGQGWETYFQCFLALGE